MTKNTDYTVNSKDELRQLSKGGEVVTAYRIWATSKGGTNFHVDIPEAELGKSDVKLTERAKILDGI